MQHFKNDAVTCYLREIGRVPLLTAAQEIELGTKVQSMMLLLEIKRGCQNRLQRKPTLLEWAEAACCSINDLKNILAEGSKARNQFTVANLRLVVCIAKNHQGRGLELLDLIQEVDYSAP